MQVNTQKRENTQTTILALLLAYKGGCTLRQLDKDYYELEGEHIPWKGLGYSSLLNLLHGMSKSVKIEDKNNTIMVKGIASEKSKHVSKLVAEQKSQKNPTGRKIYKPSHYFPKTAPFKIRISSEILKRIVSWINDHPDGIHKDYVFQEVQSCMPFANITMRDMEEQLKELSHQICQKDNKIYPVQSKALNFDYSINSNDILHSEFVSHEKQKWKSSIVTAAGDEDSDDMLDYNEEDIFEVVPSNYRSPSLNVQSPISTSTSVKKPISECQNQWLEHTLVVQSKQNDANNPCGSTSNGNSEIAKEFNNNIRESEGNCLNYKNAEILVNDRVKARLESLIKNHPDGIWCADLPEKYLEEYKVPLNYAELGFNSVREFAAELSQIFHCVQPHDTGDFILYYAKSVIPVNKSEEKPKDLTKLYQIFEINDKEALPATVSLNTCIELIPDEVMTIGECVGNLSVADLLKIEDPYVEVLVVEVFTPSFFWVQLRNKQNMFKKFMDNLHNFYLTKSHQYVIPPVVLERGLNCACVYNGIWHRGIIKTVKPDFQVTVMFYDYGTLKTYSPDEVFYLHKTFSRLPAQAIPCGLVNVRPCRGSKWSCSATHNFAVRTSQIPFVATIASINVEENSMLVTLTDTLEEEDVHINDWLVEQKLAEHGKMVCMKKRNFPFYYYLKCRDRFKKKFEATKTSIVERNLKNEAALYNLNSAMGLLHKDSSNQVHSNKTDFCNENREKFEFLKINTSCENNILIEKADNFAYNSKGKASRRQQSLYKELLSLKLKSMQEIENNSSNNMNVTAGNNECLDSISVSNRLIKQNMYKNITSLTLHDVASENTKADILYDKVIPDNYERNSRTSGDTYNISEEYSNIPVQYANHFDIQDSENELSISYARSIINKSNEDEIKYVDWSQIWEDTTHIKESVSENVVIKCNKSKIPHKIIFKSQNDIPLAENCFLKAVHNSSYYVDQDEKTCWSPVGNISKMHDVSPSILNDIKMCMNSVTNDKIILIPQDVLETLSEGKHSEVTSNAFKSINASQCTSSLIPETIEYIQDNDALCSKSFEEQAEDCKGNDYIYMSALTSKRKLLEKLLLIDNVSSNTSDIDSDDFSTSEKSVSCQYSIHNSDEKTEVKDKDSVYICEDKTSEFCTGIDVKAFSCSVPSGIIDLHTQELFQVNDRKLHTNDVTVTLSEISALPKTAELTEKLTITSIPTHPLIEEFNSVQSFKDIKKQLLLNEPPLVETIEAPVDTLIIESSLTGETVQGQLVPVKEPSSNIITESSHIPVFNDNNIESDEEEWDAQVLHADLYTLLGGSCPLNKSIDYQNCPEEVDPGLSITEIDDNNSIVNTNHKGTYQNVESVNCDTLHPNEVLDQCLLLKGNEKENVMNGGEKFETQTSAISIEKSLVRHNESLSNRENAVLISHKLHGKAKTLVEMLNKVKLL